ncbi:hypothetical protein XELAEV_18000765mg, partial [Xenopus laevis]
LLSIQTGIVAALFETPQPVPDTYHTLSTQSLYSLSYHIHSGTSSICLMANSHAIATFCLTLSCSVPAASVCLFKAPFSAIFAKLFQCLLSQSYCTHTHTNTTHTLILHTHTHTTLTHTIILLTHTYYSHTHTTHTHTPI